MNDFRRKKNRLEGHDYSQNGAYFITICVKDRHEILWDSTSVGAAFGRPALSETGMLIDKEIKKIESIYDCVRIDNYVIMPNHIHMIISLTSIDTMDKEGRPKAAPTISGIINKFKGSITKQHGSAIWQKLFHDHIIRNDADYQRIWQYIEENPIRWSEDMYYIKSTL